MITPCSPLALLPEELACHCVYRASSDGVDENLLVLLHGLGDTAGPFARMAERMALPQTACLALGGPLSVPFAGRAWFPAIDGAGDLIEASPGERRRVQGLERTRALLQAFLDGLDKAGWPRRRVHLFGFSQGGTVALDLALHSRGAQRRGGCIAVSAALLEETLAAAQAPAPSPAAGREPRGSAAAGTPVLMTYGQRDVQLKPAVLATARVLRQAGCSVEVHAVTDKAGGMVAGAEEMRVLMAFWAHTLSRRPAAGTGPGGGGTLVEVTDPADVAAVMRSRSRP
ncbi:hypothetical protein WJX81_003864 [Elliptochloris bilobata]|uniref:Phospholipase/carboxylesterase/thioesterase domain-containing protein n=1 Tax=Elliptochloris bilobata TaxID=381761 RepID=A0AAW1QWK1_9CHLO